MQEQQLFQEVQYGKHTDYLSIEILDIYNCLIEPITNYLADTYYASKNARLIGLEAEPIARLVAIQALKHNTITPIQAVIGCMAPHLHKDRLLGAKTAAEVLGVCEGDLYEIIYPEYDEGILFSSNYTASKEVTEILDQQQYMLPMLCKPTDWSSNKEGGWLTKSESAIHGSINHHKEKVSLDVLNNLQAIEWSLDTEMLLHEETPNKDLDTLDKVKQFKDLKRISKTAYKELLNMGNKFHFVWRFDKRGRSYSQGYHVNSQSTGYKKAILNFNQKTLIQGEL